MGLRIHVRFSNGILDLSNALAHGGTCREVGMGEFLSLNWCPFLQRVRLSGCLLPPSGVWRPTTQHAAREQEE
jgi:hypothetical protein